MEEGIIGGHALRFPKGHTITAFSVFPISLSDHLSVFLSIHPSVHLSVICLSVYPSIHLFAHPSIYLKVGVRFHEKGRELVEGVKEKNCGHMRGVNNMKVYNIAGQNIFNK